MIPSISESFLKSKNAQQLEEYFRGLVDEGQDLEAKSSEWPTVQCNGAVTTRRKPKEDSDGGHRFVQRSSKHTDVTYDQLRRYLFVDHSFNEVKYVELMMEAKRLFALDYPHGEAGVYRLGYKATVASSREFVELVLTHEDRDKDGKRYFMVVSKPVEPQDLPARPSFVRGSYESWEIVREKDDGTVEWVCIQHSSSGGWVPKVMSDWVVVKEFHKDVEALIKYVKSQQK